ncbi:2-hydroxy-3-keto-5-methylthiopentenyl-1-phosphate phosphatase [Metabacillus hrfriensis]|uniref:2-hydroxy-3-keto-5-methylthiopentenyl-1-phosphate phosphatase n=1 Tax=Metabacillus hrfriensis TaxID=3048891 RepID=A0ACD4RG35_9BACI|nr:2-hydroxy-3-keto-5-methylthiopentenyl-1-phosphate phosphatase [Metabacillus sp. CT-WN-B3]WHZ59449.1 2-hydroxy-3-keto-5-methylthiopentenyl-1-phosphate phosphatase [Metabacillus sp. CT-WN-B3]
MSKPIIICDFDGTITNNDNIIAIMKKFAPPEWNALKDDVLRQRISVRAGVEKMFRLIPSELKYDIIQYLLFTAQLRDGFREFVQYTEEEEIPLYIVSGGIDFFVHPLLNGLVDRDRVYCNAGDFSGQAIEILWPNSCDDQCSNDCGCCKPSLIRKLAAPDQEVIVIGDSVTDLEAAKLADFVFARDFLLGKCQSLDLPHQEFTTFFDVIDRLKKKQEAVS